MAYKCDKCEAAILVLRLGYCMNCREPISSEILPDSKKQALAEAEREYERKCAIASERKKGGKFLAMEIPLDLGSIGGDMGSFD